MVIVTLLVEAPFLNEKEVFVHFGEQINAQVDKACLSSLSLY